MTLRTWARRIGLGLVAGGSVAALLALTGAPQAAPQLEWTHSGTSVTHFECFVDGAYAGNLGKPEPVGNAYSANLSLCGQITGGQHTLTVKACNYTNCTDTTTSLALVTLGTIGTGTEACVEPVQDTVQAAVNAADYGDKVQVCDGTETWTVKAQGCTADTALCMKKGIYLVGGIGGTTTITLAGTPPSRPAIVYQPDATSITNDTPFSMTGFTIDANGVTFGNGMVGVVSAGPTAITNITVHHNVLRNSLAYGVYTTGPIYGVVHHNTFDNVSVMSRQMGMDAVSWALGHTAYGTANSMFIESNTQTFAVGSTFAGLGPGSNGQGGSSVYRYNTIDAANQLLNTTTIAFRDSHGLQSMWTVGGTKTCGDSPYNYSGACLPNVDSCEQFSHVKTEDYGNDYQNMNAPLGYQHFGYFRGSRILMFNNRFTGSAKGDARPEYTQYSCDSCQSPASPAYSQHIQNTYVFNNRVNGTDAKLVPVSSSGYDYCYEYAEGAPYKITENVDYWNLNASFDGTAGIGCGTAAQFSAITTCTPGVGYWVTNQSCSDMTGMVGASPATPISGTLYKCTSTDTWESYYTPYTYPHPKAATPAAAYSLRVK